MQGNNGAAFSCGCKLRLVFPSGNSEEELQNLGTTTEGKTIPENRFVWSSHWFPKYFWYVGCPCSEGRPNVCMICTYREGRVFCVVMMVHWLDSKYSSSIQQTMPSNKSSRTLKGQGCGPQDYPKKNAIRTFDPNCLLDWNERIQNLWRVYYTPRLIVQQTTATTKLRQQ